ncbi:hypothetical protein N9J72_01585 [Candidatus Gracilibacteria bacterium]|nr:hypothetical protein [Candidatus Gracilibacteria bacterium]
MNKSKIQISARVLSAIAGSNIIGECEKLRFLKYVGYLTRSEQRELCTLI